MNTGRYVLELRAMEGAGTVKVRQSFERLFERAGDQRRSAATTARPLPACMDFWV